MNKNINKILLRTVLNELKEVIKLDYEGKGANDEWDGNVSYEGIKRLIYGLWNDGRNEKDDDMTEHMSIKAEKKYRSMIKNYSKLPKIKTNF